MEMERLIRVRDVEVEEFSCTVAFNATLYVEGDSLQCQTIELTHNKLYKLLETAKDIKAYYPNIEKGEKTTKFVTFKQGIVEFEVYQRREQ